MEDQQSRQEIKARRGRRRTSHDHLSVLFALAVQRLVVDHISRSTWHAENIVSSAFARQGRISGTDLMISRPISSLSQLSAATFSPILHRHLPHLSASYLVKPEAEGEGRPGRTIDLSVKGLLLAVTSLVVVMIVMASTSTTSSVSVPSMAVGVRVRVRHRGKQVIVRGGQGPVGRIRKRTSTRGRES
jgi:hypothetical protein